LSGEAPDDLIWLITSRCNLACKHCYAYLYRKEEELNTRDVIKIIEDAANAGVERIHYTGGEPLIREDIFDVLRHTLDLGLSTSIFTNATMVNERIANELAKLDVVVYTSMDGYSKETYESIRGINTWDRFIRGLKALINSGVYVHVNISVTETNWEYVGKTIRKALEFGASSISIIPAMPSGRALSNGIYVRAKHFLQALKEATKVAREMGIILWVWCAPFVPIVERSPYIRCGNCRYWDVMDITPSGRVILCDVLNYEICDIKKLGIKGAWKVLKEHPLVQRIMSPRLRYPCSDCPLSDYCKGGCYARAQIISGSIEAPDPLCPIVSGHVRIEEL